MAGLILRVLFVFLALFSLFTLVSCTVSTVPMIRKTSYSREQPQFDKLTGRQTSLQLYGSYYAGTFHVAVTVGSGAGQITMYPIIDTGSYVMFLDSNDCLADNATYQGYPCEADNQGYDQTQSTSSEAVACSRTCQSCSNDNFCIVTETYGDRTNYSAVLVTDLVRITGTDVQGRGTIGAVYKSYGFTQEFDGIMGWSYKGGRVDLPSSYDQIFKSSDTIEVFAMCLQANAGSLTVGGLDAGYYQGSVYYTPLSNTQYIWWTINVNYMGIVGGPTFSYDFSQSINLVDSGTTGLYLPGDAWEEMVNYMRQNCSQSNFLEGVCGPINETIFAGYCVYLNADQFNAYPTFAFNFPGANGEPFTVPVKPSNYFIPSNYAPNGNGDSCYFLRITNYNALGFKDNKLLLGETFMLDHYVVFDAEAGRLGFAQANCEGAANVASATATTAVVTPASTQGSTTTTRGSTTSGSNTSDALRSAFSVLFITIIFALFN